MEKEHCFVYISSWTNFGGTGGLAAYRMDTATGQMEHLKTYCEDVSFGMSVLDRERGLLYAVNETAELPEAELDGGGGSIYIFKIDPITGLLTELRHTPSFGANPCYLTIDREKRFMMVAHHASHAAVTRVNRGADGRYHIQVEHDDVTLCLFPMNDDGTVDEPVDVVKHTGWLQTKAIPNPGMHTACMSPSGELFAVVDIGESRVYMYRIDRKNGRLYEAAAPYADEPDSLPRYCLFHPSLPYLYLNHEMGSLDVTCFRYDESGALTLLGRTSSVPSDHQWKFHDEQQDMRMHPNGRYIYDAVNGPNYISVFEIDESTGMLKLIQNQQLDGQWARSCAVSPDGKWLIATCLQSLDVDVFAVGDDGRLTHSGFKAQQSSPSWSTFF